VRVTIDGWAGPMIFGDDSELLVLKELMQEGEYDLTGLAAPRVILDLGANVGISAVLRARGWVMDRPMNRNSFRMTHPQPTLAPASPVRQTSSTR
jgi:hypothetical protein